MYESKLAFNGLNSFYLYLQLPPSIFQNRPDSTFIMSLCNDLQNITNSSNIYLFKVNNRNTRKRRETCSKLTIKTSE